MLYGLLAENQLSTNPPGQSVVGLSVSVSQLVSYCGKAFRMAWVSSATAIRQNSNCDLVCTIPLL